MCVPITIRITYTNHVDESIINDIILSLYDILLRLQCGGFVYTN